MLRDWIAFRICALSSALNWSEDNELTYVKYGPCKDMVENIKSYETCVGGDDPFTITEEDQTLKDDDSLLLDEDDEMDIVEWVL